MNTFKRDDSAFCSSDYLWIKLFRSDSISKISHLKITFWVIACDWRRFLGHDSWRNKETVLLRVSWCDRAGLVARVFASHAGDSGSNPVSANTNRNEYFWLFTTLSGYGFYIYRDHHESTFGVRYGRTPHFYTNNRGGIWALLFILILHVENIKFCIRNSLSW